MNKTLVITAAALAIGLSGSVFANGYGEDYSWQFERQSSKHFRLQQRLAEELLSNGGPGPGNTTITGENVYLGDQVLGDKSQTDASNCINCSTVVTDISVGDSFGGAIDVGSSLTQDSGEAQQTNGTLVESNEGTVNASIGSQTN